MQRKMLTLLSLMLLVAMLAACAAPAAPAAPAEGEAAAAPAEAAPAEIGPITLWSKFNDANPQNSQDEWLAAMLAGFGTDTGLEISNVFQPYDQINSKLNLAVLAGGDVPDVSYMDSQYLGLYFNNGSLMDLTEYVQSAPWFADVDPAAIAACTGPDGKIYCVPSNLNARLNYYWTAAYPDGFPADTDALLAAAATLKEQGKYAMTFKASETFGSESVLFSLVNSFGGSYGDAEGKVAWATPETVAAVDFVRELFASEYAPEVALASGFDFETPFKDGSAGGFGAGSWSYVYLNPLTSFDGTVFDNGSASVEDALKAGALGIAAPLAAPGKDPATLLLASAWAIPAIAENVDGAKAFIDYQMDAARNTEFSVSYGGLPVITASLQDPVFADSPYWQAVAEIASQYGRPNAPLLEYDKAMLKFSDIVVQLVQNPDLDTLEELQKAQDELNAGL
ncbi:MAG: extracellular solute-binding protein [Caldilineaceae bacterium]